MSLCCHECWQDLSPLRPDQEMPGREGTMVQPILMALVWNPEFPDKPQWILHPVPADNSRALCFECLKNKIPPERISQLDRIFVVFQAEMVREKIVQSMKNRWVSSDDPLFQQRITASEIFDEAFKQIDQKHCLFCERELPDQKLPVFELTALNRIKSSHGSPSAPWETNYQWSNNVTAITSFPLCFECLRQNFPRTFADLGRDLLGRERVPHPKAKNELLITSEVAEHLTAEQLSEVLKMGGEIKDPPH